MKTWTVGLLLLVPVAGLGPSGPHEAQAPDEKPILVAHAGSLPVIARVATSPIVLDYPRRRVQSVPPPVVVLPQAVPVVPVVRPPVAQGNRIWTQSEIVCAAAADAAALPAGIAHYIRYLDLGNIPAAERQDYLRVLNGHANLLSRNADIIPLYAVPNTDYAVARINIADYGWEHIWEKMADHEPYYFTTIETKTADVVTVWPGGVWPDDGQFYAAGAFKFHDKRVVKSRAIAPWVVEGPGGQAAITTLVGTLKSKAPIIRADWFLNVSAIQEGREGVGYYDWLKIKDEDDYFKLVGYDAKLAEPFGKEIREAVSDSGVTLQPRALWRDNSQGGGIWRSIDFIKATDKKNPLRVLGKDIEKFADAHENFGHLPNGWWATGVFNNKKKRQNSAPNNIANADKQGGGNDTAIHVNYSCLKCHRNGGLKEIDGWARNLFQPPLQLQSTDYKTFLSLKRQYLRDLKGFIDRDRAIYAEAVKEATGFTTEQFSDKYAAAFEQYEYGRFDLVRAARSLGTTPDHFRMAIDRQIKQLGQTDLVLGGFLRGQTLGARQWEEVLPLAHAALRGVYLPP